MNDNVPEEKRAEIKERVQSLQEMIQMPPTIEMMRHMPFGLKIPDEHFVRRNVVRQLGDYTHIEKLKHLHGASHNSKRDITYVPIATFNKWMSDEAFNHELSPKDVFLCFARDYVFFTAEAPETNEAYLSRLNQQRIQLLRQFMRKAESELSEIGKQQKEQTKRASMLSHYNKMRAQLEPHLPPLTLEQLHE